MSYLALPRGEGHRRQGEGKQRDKRDYVIDSFKYPIYI
jgi:hypothetical protein